jgi:DNA-binding CsgD family transcriptional regulator
LLARGFRALIAAHRDDQVALDDLLRPADPPAATNAWYLAFFLMAARSTAAERDGRGSDALDRLLESMDRDVSGEFRELSPDRCLWLPEVVRLALAAGDRATAGQATRACAAEAERNPLPGTRIAALHCRGLVDADPDTLRAAADAYRELEVPLFCAPALESAAVLLAERNDTTAARRAYTDALRGYADLDAAWDIRRAEARLRPFGIRPVPRRRPATAWQALTPTEQRIAALIATGRSNADIAAELYLSRNTVQTHVSHILTKLDARSRVDIARAVLDQRFGDRGYVTGPARS